jgi:hypothetical protein
MGIIRQACWWVGIRMLLAAEWLIEMSQMRERVPRSRARQVMRMVVESTLEREVA